MKAEGGLKMLFAAGFDDVGRCSEPRNARYTSLQTRNGKKMDSSLEPLEEIWL